MFTNKKIRLSELHKQFNFELIQDADISFASKIGSKNPYMDFCLTYAINERFVHLAANSKNISAIITNQPKYKEKIISMNKGLILSDNPKTLLSDIQNFLSTKKDFQWKSFDSKISNKTMIHPSALIASKNVIIAEGTIIGPNCVVNERSIIGKNCRFNENVIIGSEPFEVTGACDNRSIISQSGGVKIENNVTIQALSTIVKATFGGFTTLSDNVKIDSHVHIAHDVQVGKNTSIAASSFIAGNVFIGEGTFVGPNSTISNGIEIGDNAWITIGSNVIDNVGPGKKVSGNFAIDHNKFLKNYKKS